jgi:hypothetical protein
LLKLPEASLSKPRNGTIRFDTTQNPDAVDEFLTEVAISDLDVNRLDYGRTEIDGEEVVEFSSFNKTIAL